MVFYLKMRSSTPAGAQGHCRRCLMQAAFCVCALIPRIDNAVEILILRHIKEAWKTSNSARLVGLALARAAIVAYGDKAHGPPSAPEREGTWLLFPGAAAAPAGSPRRLVVLDGTWAQARHMAQRLPWLRGLPRLSLSGPPVDGLRRAPKAGALPTLVAVARALGALGEPAQARALVDLHAAWVDRMRLAKGGKR